MTVPNVPYRGLAMLGVFGVAVLAGVGVLLLALVRRIAG